MTAQVNEIPTYALEEQQGRGNRHFLIFIFTAEDDDGSQ
jgi:hypothetical protein